MRTSHAVAGAAIVLGLLLALVSGLGDTVGIVSTECDFGWKQIVGVAAGIALVATGIGLLLRPKVDEVADDQPTAT